MEEAVGVGKFARYVIEPRAEGVYLFVFESTDSAFPEKDFLEDTTVIAKELCEEEFGVKPDHWRPYSGESLR